MMRRLLNLARQPLARNIVVLYVVRVVNQLVPLATIPYLARVLGPAEWGLVAVAQAFAMYGIISVQYGFDLSGVREVARQRHDSKRLGELWGGILACQLSLALVVIVVAGLAYRLVPAFLDDPRLLVAALVFAIIQGTHLHWFFTGLERIPLLAAIDLPTKIGGLIAIFLIIDGPGDGWKVLAIYACASFVSTSVCYAVLLREFRPKMPDLKQVMATFRMGFSLFLMQLAGVMNTVGNAFLLSLMAPPQQVAFFAAPEKLSRPLAWLTLPINRALLPRLSHLLTHEPAQAHAMARLALICLSVLGVALSLMVILLAPWLIPLVFGPGYEAATPVLRVLALAMPLLIINDALGSQWLIPHGLDRPLSYTILAAAGMTVGLALLLVPTYQAYGMAWVAVLVELFIFAGLVLTLARNRHMIAARVRPAAAPPSLLGSERPS